MDNRFMQRAVALAREGMRAGDGGPFGAVIVRNGAVLAESANRVIATGDPTNHAEIIAIRKACAVLGSVDLSGCELYTNGEPCPMCLGAIYWARLSRVHYANTRENAAEIGFDDALIYEEAGREPSERAICFEQVPDRDAVEVFREWGEREDGAGY